MTIFTGGAISPQSSSLFVEDVFSTFIHDGTSATRSVTTGLDMANEGGLVITKARDIAYNPSWVDTERGVTQTMWSHATSAQLVRDGITAFTDTGFTLGSHDDWNDATYNYVSWSFRKAPRFFDIVTYTGTGSLANFAHNLGVAPGMIIYKNYSNANNWGVYHRSTGATGAMRLNQTNAMDDVLEYFNDTAPTDTQFTVSSHAIFNTAGQSYVAYLFAHDPLGESGDGSDGMIACGSYTGNGVVDGPEIDLGWEPQYLMVKNATGTTGWVILDSMRGIPTDGLDTVLYANTTAADYSLLTEVNITATGFKVVNSNFATNQSGNTFIYMAIRRPMKVPTAGTEVFHVGQEVVNVNFPVGFVPDASLYATISSAANRNIFSRLTGNNGLLTNTFAAQYAGDNEWDAPNGMWHQGGSGGTLINYLFKRAPGFMEVVAYTGTGVAGRTVSHGLVAVPELILVKSLSGGTNWSVYSSTLGPTQKLTLDDATAPITNIIYWNDTSPTESVFSVGTNNQVNSNGATYVAYMFATLAGISKVGSYTGTGGTQTIDCGFEAGARFVLVKAVSAVGDWNLFDTVRGIAVGNDSVIRLNTTAAELTTVDFLDPHATGFTAEDDINNNGVTYIYLAIA